jgi:hypothetical protein
VPQVLTPARRMPHEQNATMTAVAWSPNAELDCAQWIQQGERLGAIGRGIAWWIGDWVNYGNTKFGEKYARAARITGYDAQTLMNMAYVAASFTPNRRRAALSWSHHAEVSALDVDEQDELLAHAEQQKLSVRGLREEIRTRGRRTTTRDKKPEADEQAHETPMVCPNCGCQLNT